MTISVRPSLWLEKPFKGMKISNSRFVPFSSVANASGLRHSNCKSGSAMIRSTIGTRRGPGDACATIPAGVRRDDCATIPAWLNHILMPNCRIKFPTA